jgi:putative secretion ATPase (PEP-CTERM system associated)
MFEEFYGFQAKPFQLTPDPAFYFESLTHKKALSYLGYGLAQGEGFVVITGEVGAGKSTLVAHLMATIDPARMTVANVVTSALDGEAIIHVVAQAFGLPVAGHDKASALGAIERFLHDEARAGRRCLLIVDEAQNLTVEALEELRMLSNFQLGSHPLLQTLLLGQPEFRQTLQHSEQLEQLRQRVIATHHLAAMQPEEVQPYIEHRLGCAGWQGNPSFEAAVFAEIHAQTGGIPRRINQIVNRLLLLGAVDQSTHIDTAMLQQVVAEMGHDAAIIANSATSGASSTAAAPGYYPNPQLDGHPAPASAKAIAVEGLDMAAVATLIETALSDRDARIGALQQSLLEVSASIGTTGQGGTELSADHVSTLKTELDDARATTRKLEARLGEHEHTLRHALTMMIEWIEGDGDRREAA